MTKEEKDLLLKDLCARLPYGVKIQTWYEGNIITDVFGIDRSTCVVSISDSDENAKVYLDNVKPYLRPMSSMTAEESLQLTKILNSHIPILSKTQHLQRMARQYYDSKYLTEIKMLIDVKNSIDKTTIIETPEDFYNAHHLDYRGLIPMGLAIKALEGMYKTE